MAAEASPRSSPGGAASSAAAAATFQQWLERMKEPALADVVRETKAFTRRFEERPPGEPADAAADAAAAQAFFGRMDAAVRRHPAWRGATQEALDEASEGIEKYVMSKIWGRTFGAGCDEAERDARYARLAGALAFADLATLAGVEALPPPDEARVAAAAAELLRADRYKAPRDKLLCLVNMMRGAEDVVAGVARAGGAFRGADAFFPAMLLATLRARPPRLASTLEYVRRFRFAPRLSGEADFVLATLESVAAYLDTVDWRHLRVPRREFLEHLAAAGIPEAELELRADGAAAAAAGAAGGEGGAVGAAAGELEALALAETEAAAEPAAAVEVAAAAEPPATAAAPADAPESPVVGVVAAAPVAPPPAAAPPRPPPASLEIPDLAPPGAAPLLLSPLDAGEPTPTLAPRAAPFAAAAAPAPAPAPAPADDGAALLLGAGAGGLAAALIDDMVADGTPLVLEEEAAGRLAARHPFVYADSGDLAVGDVAALLAAYRELVLRHEALSLALARQLGAAGAVAGGGGGGGAGLGAGAAAAGAGLAAGAAAAGAAAAGALAQLQRLSGWGRGAAPPPSAPAAPGAPAEGATLLHALFGSPAAARPSPRRAASPASPPAPLASPQAASGAPAPSPASAAPPDSLI
jgi:hypothetical protein